MDIKLLNVFCDFYTPLCYQYTGHYAQTLLTGMLSVISQLCLQERPPHLGAQKKKFQRRNLRQLCTLMGCGNILRATKHYPSCIELFGASDGVFRCHLCLEAVSIQKFRHHVCQGDHQSLEVFFRSNMATDRLQVCSKKCKKNLVLLFC